MRNVFHQRKKLLRVVFKAEIKPSFATHIDPRVIPRFLDYLYKLTVCRQTDT